MPELKALSDEEVHDRIHLIDDQRLFVIAEAFRRGVTIDEVHEITMIDKWFLQKIMNIVNMEKRIKSEPMTEDLMRAAKKMGFADVVIADYIGKTWQEVREMRKGWGIIPTYKHRIIIPPMRKKTKLKLAIRRKLPYLAPARSVSARALSSITAPYIPYGH